MTSINLPASKISEEILHVVLVYDDPSKVGNATAALRRLAPQYLVAPGDVTPCSLARLGEVQSHGEEAECTQWLSFTLSKSDSVSDWLLDWVYQWALCRRVRDAAVVWVTDRADASRLLQFTVRNELNFIFVGPGEDLVAAPARLQERESLPLAESYSPYY